MITEASLRLASSGFGIWTYTDAAPIDYAKTTEDFAAHMSREYYWRWADELNGVIENQGDGKPFAWRMTEDDEWAYGIVWEEEE